MLAAAHANPYLVDMPVDLNFLGRFWGQRPQTLEQLRARVKPLKTEYDNLLKRQIELDKKITRDLIVSPEQAAFRAEFENNGVRMGVLNRKITRLDQKISIQEAKENPWLAQRAREQEAKAAQEAMSARKAQMGAVHLHAPRL